mmetsp:Transcript_47948/g.144913  ORF Transcript_47948/g.144913 Transcript_47948/m.144913 type:complete len:336 (+) Transcript_47948:30-1037(+)
MRPCRRRRRRDEERRSERRSRAPPSRDHRPPSLAREEGDPRRFQERRDRTLSLPRQRSPGMDRRRGRRRRHRRRKEPPFFAAPPHGPSHPRSGRRRPPRVRDQQHAELGIEHPLARLRDARRQRDIRRGGGCDAVRDPPRGSGIDADAARGRSRRCFRRRRGRERQSGGKKKSRQQWRQRHLRIRFRSERGARNLLVSRPLGSVGSGRRRPRSSHRSSTGRRREGTRGRAQRSQQWGAGRRSRTGRSGGRRAELRERAHPLPLGRVSRLGAECPDGAHGRIVPVLVQEPRRFRRGDSSLGIRHDQRPGEGGRIARSRTEVSTPARQLRDRLRSAV